VRLAEYPEDAVGFLGVNLIRAATATATNGRPAPGRIHEQPSKARLVIFDSCRGTLSDVAAAVTAERGGRRLAQPPGEIHHHARAGKRRRYRRTTVGR